MKVIDNAQLPDHAQWCLSFIGEVFASHLPRLKETKIDTVVINRMDANNIYCSAHGYDFVIETWFLGPCTWDNDGNLIEEMILYRAYFMHPTQKDIKMPFGSDLFKLNVLNFPLSEEMKQQCSERSYH